MINEQKLKDIVTWLKGQNIIRYKLNADLSIDVFDDVYLSAKIRYYLPEYIQFGVVAGDFYIDNNKLISLKGCPYWVKGNFSCKDNVLKSLEFAPSRVDGDYIVENNGLTSLKSMTAQYIGRSLYTKGNQIPYEELQKINLNIKGYIIV